MGRWHHGTDGPYPDQRLLPPAVSLPKGGGTIRDIGKKFAAVRGWCLSTPAITRKTDRGLPEYRDAEESDVHILSGAGSKASK